MKKFITIALAISPLFFGCSKNVIVNSSNFSVNGVHDVSLTNNTVTSATMPLNIQNDGGEQETVTLSLSGVPANVTVDNGLFITSGIPTFTSVLKLGNFNGATPGTYPLTLTATGAVSGAKTYNFNLTVNPELACTSQVVGGYSNCSPGPYGDQVTADGSEVNKIWFDNIQGQQWVPKIYGKFNCENNTIYIPQQTTYYPGNPTPYQISGNGVLTVSGGTKIITLNLNGSSTAIVMQP